MSLRSAWTAGPTSSGKPLVVEPCKSANSGRLSLVTPFLRFSTPLERNGEPIMKVSYEFREGAPVEIEVDDSIGEVIIQFEKEQYNKNRAETRRHDSVERMEEEDFAQFPDNKQNVEQSVEQSIVYESLYAAISQLTPDQQVLVQRVYFQDQSLTQIAREDGVSVAAISNRLSKIHKKIKKLLE